MSRFLVAMQPTATAPQIVDVLKTLNANQGRLVQAWGPFAWLVEGPDSARVAAASKPGVVRSVGTGSFIPPIPTLDPVATALIAGLNFGLLPAYLAPPSPVNPAPTVLAPKGCSRGSVPGALPRGSTPAGQVGSPSDPGLALAPKIQFPGRRAFVGTIGVAILMIDGPVGSAARFTLDDQATALKALSDAFDHLYNLAPAAAHLVFVPAIHHVEIALDPATVPFPANIDDPKDPEFEPIEKTWRDLALPKLGVSTGRAGYRELVNKSHFLYTADWGLVVVITKYRGAWPAYNPEFHDVILSYDEIKTRIGLAKFSHVVAHEIGHAVGALDEYASSQCKVTDKCGFSNGPNLNCEVLNPISVDCMMKHEQVNAVCLATKSHFGWTDQNLDGVLDPYDPTFVPFP